MNTTLAFIGIGLTELALVLVVIIVVITGLVYLNKNKKS